MRYNLPHSLCSLSGSVDFVDITRHSAQRIRLDQVDSFAFHNSTNPSAANTNMAENVRTHSSEVDDLPANATSLDSDGFQLGEVSAIV